MTIDDQIRDGKLQYHINREASKISALPSNKFNKYENLTGEEVLASNQKETIQQAKFTYSPLSKAFEKQIKTIEDQGEKQIHALKDLKDREKNKYMLMIIRINYWFQKKNKYLKISITKDLIK